MTESVAQVREVDVDRVRELTSIGAGHAATAFARLVGRPCQMCVPTVKLLRAESAAVPFAASVEDDERRGMTGIFFEIEGGGASDRIAQRGGLARELPVRVARVRQHPGFPRDLSDG